MNWQQKFAAVASLCDVCVRMRKPDDWYVSAVGRSLVFAGGALLGGSYGNGATPEAAIEDDWTKVGSGTPLKIEDHRGIRSARWNGFMWDTITQEQAAAISPEDLP